MIPAVILAAGLSTRMGRLKATLPLGADDTFLTRIARTLLAAGVEDVIAVIGHEAESVRQSIDASGLPVRLIVNPEYERGQFSSVLAGLNVVDRPGTEAMLLTLVDVPFVSSATVAAVLQRYRATKALVVRPVRGDAHGHPVLIDRLLFSRLRSADPAAGAKPVVRAHVSEAGDVAIDDEGAFLDVDTPDDYARVLEGLGERRPLPGS